MGKRIALTILAVTLVGFAAKAQQITQTIRGKIVDDVTEFPLIGATIYIQNSEPRKGSITDVDGSFKITEVPIGRHWLAINYIGYEPLTIPDVLVHSGKSVFLEIKLKESTTVIEEVVVVGSRHKDVPLNELAAVSARAFTVEETQRYAGGLDDPGRMVTAFAGVTATTLGQNAVIIRGNAPKGVQWRMEGLEIPSPSHFAGATITGGGFVTLLSNQVLANSDFMTGAFPSEYGNALAGVFDMKLRSGNNEEREHTFQAGVLGIDIASEGPFSKNSKASYLFNYRYSTLGLIEPILPEEANTIRYQDLSFKLTFPTKRKGEEFSFWGVSGKDFGAKNEPVVMEPADWEVEDDRQEYEYGFLVGASGVNHKINFGSNTMIQTAMALSVNDSYWNIDELNSQLELAPKSRVDNLTGRYSVSTTMNHKFTKRHHNRSGISYHQHFYNIKIEEATNDLSMLNRIVNEKNANGRFQAFTQSKFRVTDQHTLNMGVHSQYFGLIDQLTLEPRASFQWHLSPLKTLSIGYGNHSQMEDLKVYLIQDMNGNLRNKNLSMTRAHHLVLGYDWVINDNLRLKVEPYFQYLYDAPVVADSTYSMLNFEQDWFLNETLVNEGYGMNYGLDVTLERFLDNNFYYLITGSVFDSEYKGGDGVWRDTRFNRSYAFNILAGKEWQVGTGDNKWLGINGRFNLMGGLRSSPIDLPASIAQQEPVFNGDRAFENQDPAINYLDFTISYRKNKPKHSTVWGLQVKNALGYEDFDGYQYNFSNDQIDEIKSTIIIPSLTYKIEF